MKDKKILLTGATGFVGNRLLTELLDLGYKVRALTRNKTKFVIEHQNLEVVQGDLLNSDSLMNIFEGIDTAFYLVHGLASDEKNFEYIEMKCAANFVAHAKQAKIKKIVYLGGLGPDSNNESMHLRSRHLTGKILGLSSIPVLEFRASIVLGPGSTSFEMMKALCERSPVQVAAPWLDNLCQPIYVEDLMNYLVASIDKDIKKNVIVEIGGKQSVSYSTLMSWYLEISGEKRPKLSLASVDKTYLIPILEVIIPEFFEVGKKLILSLDHHTIVTDESASENFAEINVLDTKEALELCMKNSTTSYPAVWEGEFWKALKDQDWLASLQKKEVLVKKLSEYTSELKKITKLPKRNNK